MALPSSSRFLFSLSTPTVLVLQCSTQGSTMLTPFVISSAWFSSRRWSVSGSPSLTPHSHRRLRSPLYPPWTYISLLLHTSYSIVFGLHVCLPNQTMCPLWTGILSYSSAPSASSTECDTEGDTCRVPVRVSVIESSEDKDFLQRFYKIFFLTPKK